MATRQLIVTDLKHIKSGSTQGGEDYTLWQVRATDLSGIPIDQNLRTFDELPKDIPITVEVGYFKSDRGYGDSFTLKLVEGSGTTPDTAPASPPPPVTVPQGIQATLQDLVTRVQKLEEELATLKGKPQTTVHRTDVGPPTPTW